MKKVLVIGANSYIGKSFQKYITFYYSSEYSKNKDIEDTVIENGKENIITVDAISISNGTWEEVDFSLYDVVILLSAIVHKKETKDMEDLYDKVNHRLAVEITKKAKESNVKQFIFMSTVAVYGEKATCITKDTEPDPTTYYGKSKLLAENDIIKLQSSDFKVAIIRSPMVYGEGCKGNYMKLVKLARMTPVFPKIYNKRSAIYIVNLCEFMRILICRGVSGYFSPQNQKYLCSSELVEIIGESIKHKVYMIKGFDNVIKFLTYRNSMLKKVFGDCYIEINTGHEIIQMNQYQVVDLRESVIRSLQ